MGPEAEGLAGSKVVARLATLPESPGVYLMKDAEGAVIYVGKAVVLKARVRQYFQSGKHHSPKVRAMVGVVADLEWIVTRSEVEALVLEANLIKHHRPRYNALLKDDKNYPYLKLTAGPYPRLVVARQRQRDGGRYFGPFPDGSGWRAALQLAEKLFPLRRKAVPPFKDRPCLNHDLGRCLAPCQAKVSPEAYGAMVQEVAAFLEGRHEGILARLSREMREASSSLAFERAAVLRDQLQALEAFRQRQQVVGAPDEDQDAVGIAVAGRRAAVQVFQVRGGKVIGRVAHLLPAQGEALGELVEAFLLQYYEAATDLPTELLLPAPVEGQEALAQWLGERRGRKVQVTLPQRGAKADLVRLANQNAADELTRLAWRPEQAASEVELAAVAALARHLGMAELPSRLECFDISHLGGTDIVASMVVFIDGRPAKQAYRKFMLKAVSSNDDFASMREVLARRLRRSQVGSWPKADLIVIDGGKGQLSAALAGAAAVGVTPPPMISLAKQEELIFRPGVSEPLRLSHQDPALQLLQRARDEAHRFALAFQRAKRGKRAFASALDGVAGLGPARKKNLLKRLGSVEAMRSCSAEQLAERGGLPLTVAQALVARLATQEA